MIALPSSFSYVTLMWPLFPVFYKIFTISFVEFFVPFVTKSSYKEPIILIFMLNEIRSFCLKALSLISKLVIQPFPLSSQAFIYPFINSFHIYLSIYSLSTSLFIAYQSICIFNINLSIHFISIYLSIPYPFIYLSLRTCLHPSFNPQILLSE